MARPTPNPPKEHATPRVKLPDFEALRAERDASQQKMIREIHAEFFADKPIEEMQVHVCGRGGCYCACPDGPCEHQFAGWREYETPEGGLVGTTVCKLCGMDAISHDMRCGP
jgi:hypothetical protein